MELLTETYKREISCVLSCFDRLILSGTMPEISYSQGMTKYMYEKGGTKIFDYPKFAEPFKETIRANAERIAKEHGVEIEFIRKAGIRKESIISEKIEKRGNHSGIVHLQVIEIENLIIEGPGCKKRGNLINHLQGKLFIEG